MQMPEPVVLEGKMVRLEPLTTAHLAGLREVFDPAHVRHSSYVLTTKETLGDYMNSMLDKQAAGKMVTFAIIDAASGKPIGHSTYYDISLKHERLAIGYTWLGLDYQRTGRNRECKRLLLTHAFEVLGVKRVEFEGDAANKQSLDALAGIGATHEATLRSYENYADGSRRDKFVCSITLEEWPQVKALLQQSLSRS